MGRVGSGVQVSGSAIKKIPAGFCHMAVGEFDLVL